MIGPVVFSGMAGHLVLVSMERGTPGLLLLGSWICTLPDFWDADDLALEMTDDPKIWTDGSSCLPPSLLWIVLAGVWLRERCRALLPVPGPLQAVRRVVFWGAFVALQAYLALPFGY